MHLLNAVCFTSVYCSTDKYLFAIVPTVFLGMNSDRKRKIIVICKLKTIVKFNYQGFFDNEFSERLLNFPISKYMHFFNYICKWNFQV